MDAVEQSARSRHVPDRLGETVQKQFLDFLEGFNSPNSESEDPHYVTLVQELANPERDSLSVSITHVQSTNQELCDAIMMEYYRLYPFLCQAVVQFAKNHVKDFPAGKDVLVTFTDVPTVCKLRELNSQKIGRLLEICGQVVRTHPVHPELVAGTFTCNECQTVVPDVEQQFKYTQPTICRNPVCSNRLSFHLDSAKSKFIDFQKIRMQETPDELPRGAIPRNLEVIVRGSEWVELAQAGDRCRFTGTLISVPDVSVLSLPGAVADPSGPGRGAGADGDDGVRGMKALGVRDLTYRLAFLACTVQPSLTAMNPFAGNPMGPDHADGSGLNLNLTDAEWQRVGQMAKDRKLAEHLCESIFPSIHGHDQVKKGILLMLFGGVAKITEEGTHLRGDINVCIVGDPSTSKSTMLKCVEQLIPRAVYTSGKASSAAGLTAAVVKDEESYEFVIEAGALMLADNGVCCIDEFDKMDVRDQVAIHEAMEQQTISITKAGVRATLNARTSILAAANPIGGHYDRSKSLRQNIQMSAPIMSRFDLFFVVVDEGTEVVDFAIASRIVNLHSGRLQADRTVYSLDDIRRYIAVARTFKPRITKESSQRLVRCYKQLRQRDLGGSGGSGKSAWRITVRQLESLVRLSEALARMNCMEQVLPKHVDEAHRLLSRSIVRVVQQDVDLDDGAAADEEEKRAVEEADAAAAAAHEEDATTPDTDAMDTSETPAQTVEPEQRARRQIKLSFSDYRRITNQLVNGLRSREADVDEGESAGMRRSDLIEWYLLQNEAEIESEQELAAQKLVVDRVIKRLVEKDRVLIELSQSGLGPEDETGPPQMEPLLVVHPNYVPDSER